MRQQASYIRDTSSPEVKIGDYVAPDGWRSGENLIAGDSFSSFRIPTSSGGPIKSLAVEIKITGRVTDKDGFMRGRITFVGDCEPDCTDGCKVLIRA